MWKEIIGFSNYGISDDGRVYSGNISKEKSHHIDEDGYAKIDLYENGKRKTFRVHRLVAEAYLDKIPGKDFINHKDGNKLNNHVDNLEWCTYSENMKHAFDTGLCRASRGMLGKKNPNGGRHGKQIRIVETGKIYSSIVECEKDINGNNRHIVDCLKGRQQTHRGYHFEYV